MRHSVVRRCQLLFSAGFCCVQYFNRLYMRICLLQYHERLADKERMTTKEFFDGGSRLCRPMFDTAVTHETTTARRKYGKFYTRPVAADCASSVANMAKAQVHHVGRRVAAASGQQLPATFTILSR